MKKFDREFFKDLWSITKPYWFSEEKLKARVLFFLVVFLNLFMVFLNVLFNKWNKIFFDTIQNMDEKGFFKALGEFTILAFIYIITAVYSVYLQQMLQINWRRWLTSYYLSKWMDKKVYYQMQIFFRNTDNPDQRISDDINMFVSQTLNNFLGLLNSLVTLFSFIGILWSISGPIAIGPIIIPGYMVFAAVFYALIGTLITTKLGRPLIELNFNQQRFEADFRFSLVRIRENSESVAIYSGEEKEKEHLEKNFSNIFQNYWQIMIRQKMLGWFTSGYNQIAIIFPILVAAPRYFAKAIKLGDLMQIAQAFGQVQSSLSYIINSYSFLADWYSVVDRLRTFDKNIKEVHLINLKSSIKHEEKDKIIVKNLTLYTPSQKVLIKNLNLELSEDDSLLISGPSGSGKSTLIRSLAGIWIFGEGEIYLPSKEKMLFLPQKPYLPYTTLKEAILYPKRSSSLSDKEIKDLLKEFYLSDLADLLDKEGLWSQVLSLGEQQTIAFLRIFIHKPSWVFLDEATSALDEKREKELYTRLSSLGNITYVSVAHRSSLAQFHKKKLYIKGNGEWEIK